MTRQIFAAEINFDDVPLKIRDEFNNTERNVKRFLTAFRSKVGEVYVLSTRQRFTIYIVHQNLAPLTEFFHTEHKLKGLVQYYYNSSESVMHLMATASGLLSVVKGESGILTEVAQAYEWARSTGSLGMTLDDAVTKAIETARKVRTQTGIDKYCASVVETGIELLYSCIEDLHEKTFLIVGTGNMAELALKNLTKEGITRISLYGDSEVKMESLGASYGVSTISRETIGAHFMNADIVIGAANEAVDVELAGLEDGRPKNEEGELPMRFVLDLGMPPNFDLRVVESYASEVYHLDDLRRMHASPLEAFGGLEAAWRMVMKTSHDFVHVLQLLDYSPVLSAYLTRQFSLKNSDAFQVKPRRSLRSILLFKKSESLTGTAPAIDYTNAKAHVNNHVADNARDIVRNVTSVRKFKLYLCDN